jgi:hypothetical protein
MRGSRNWKASHSIDSPHTLKTIFSASAADHMRLTRVVTVQGPVFPDPHACTPRQARKYAVYGSHWDVFSFAVWPHLTALRML